MSRNHGKHERTEAKGTGGTGGTSADGAEVTRKRTVYVVQGQVESVSDSPTAGSWAGPWTGTRGVPTFFLDADIQGITSAEHAYTVAVRVIDPLGQIPGARIHLSIVREEW